MAERINRTISEIAKCIRLNVGLSKVFQTKAMCIACYILNWSRKAALDRKVAEDVWTRKKVPFFFFLTLWWGYSDTLLMFIFSFEMISKLYPKSKKILNQRRAYIQLYMNIFYSQPYLELAMVLVELILTVQMKSQQQFGYDHISEFVPRNSFLFLNQNFHSIIGKNSYS